MSSFSLLTSEVTSETTSEATLLIEKEEKSRVELRKEITLVNAIAIVLGSVLGSGIFFAPKEIQKATGSPALSLIVWLVSGIISLCGALCYVELGTTILESGGTYIFLLKSFGPFVGFLGLWVSIIVVAPASIAIDLVILATYLLQPFFPTCNPPFYAIRLLAAVVLMVLAFINCWSVRLAVVVQDVVTYAKLLACAIIIVPGLVFLVENGTSVGSFAHPWRGTNFTAETTFVALYSGIFSFTGWDILPCLIEEMHNPVKDLFLSSVIALVISIIMFLLINVSYYAVLLPNDITATDAVAVVFAEKILKAVSLHWLIPLFIVVAIFGSLNSGFFGISRQNYVAAKEQQLPVYFAMISPNLFTPVPSIILSVSSAMFYLCIDNVADLIAYFNFMCMLIFGLAAAGLIYLRFSQPDLARPIKYNIALPFFFSVVCFTLAISYFYTKPKEALIASCILITGVPVYFLCIYPKPTLRPWYLTAAMREITCFLQKIFPVVWVLPKSGEKQKS